MAKHPVTIAPYNLDWPRWAESEADRLSRILGTNLITVEHIGSTSVPGLAAKPIIDLMPIVNDLNLLDQQKTAIEALAYRWFGEYGIPQRRYCTLTHADGKRIAHLHFFAFTSPDVQRHLAFRDYLRSHPDVAENYQKVKYRAANLHPFDSSAYSQEKVGLGQET
jgi:GrpB-like predicted nucleotidyltransferase (UPF0157 family)